MNYSSITLFNKLYCIIDLHSHVYAMNFSDDKLWNGKKKYFDDSQSLREDGWWDTRQERVYFDDGDANHFLDAAFLLISWTCKDDRKFINQLINHIQLTTVINLLMGGSYSRTRIGCIGTSLRRALKGWQDGANKIQDPTDLPYLQHPILCEFAISRGNRGGSEAATYLIYHPET